MKTYSESGDTAPQIVSFTPGKEHRRKHRKVGYLLLN